MCSKIILQILGWDTGNVIPFTTRMVLLIHMTSEAKEISVRDSVNSIVLIVLFSSVYF